MSKESTTRDNSSGRMSNGHIYGKRALVFLALACMFILGSFGVPALAWDDCPRDMVNDPYPGACSRYVDTNNDGICDHSQPEPTTNSPGSDEAALGSAASSAGSIAAATDSSTDALDGDGDGSAVASAPESAGTSGATGTAESAAPPGSESRAGAEPPAEDLGSSLAMTSGSSAAASQSGSGEQSGFFTHYMVSPIAVGFFLVYGASFVLYKTRRMRVTTHRKIWNVLLLGTFLVTGIMGILLAIDIDYDLPFRIPRSFLFWHVETGIVMTFISIFHLGWHLNYYRSIVREVTKAGQRQAPEGRTCQTVPRGGVRPQQPRAAGLQKPAVPGEE